jgi:hypothetical protein
MALDWLKVKELGGKMYRGLTLLAGSEIPRNRTLARLISQFQHDCVFQEGVIALVASTALARMNICCP